LARRDLVSVRLCIARDNEEAARRVSSTIVSFTNKQLATFPELGKVGRVDGTRELFLPRLPYFISYRHEGQTVTILRVYHTRRMWPAHL
jgi:plasmid stabilization system protein ParE